ncbi:hypothetical protein FH972_023624 [Carpinus fangiana]|uniref:Serine aminopeptidase S33 domain-containing protein n=1 Tax=Carpinus fangiana TaxID=176857 RepID=A0A5N6KXZ3_9ROSI|nr:hypothetical protein FH972_023624 [Carpinus fangiana]
MSLTNFHVREHVLPCSHVREYPRAVRSEEDDVLHMHIKRYTPISNTRPEPYDVTFIAAHANGVGKELYEPLWDELLAYSRRTKKFRIRSIWIADVAHQGKSSVLNEGKLGNDPSWYDHPRDLLLMINHFRKAMPRPLVGIGHSMGGNNIANLALLHPRLLTSVIMLDPVIQDKSSVSGNYNPAYSSSFRRDLWPSREAARKAFAKSPFYQKWDPRAFDLWIEHGLRELPTAIYPEGTVVPASKPKASPAPPPPTPISSTAATLASNPLSAAVVPVVGKDVPVTLTTPKHQEVFSFLRSKHPAANQPITAFSPTRASHPDIPPVMVGDVPFYLAAVVLTFDQIPHLRPSCLYVIGGDSTLIPPEDVDRRTTITGTGVGGSRYAPASPSDAVGDPVKQVVVKGGGHFFPFELPAVAAAEIGAWLDEGIPAFRRGEALEKAAWAKVMAAGEQSTLGKDRLWWTKAEADKIKEQVKSMQKVGAAKAKI